MIARLWRYLILTLLNIDSAISCSDWLATCNSSLYVVNLSLIASNTKGHSAYTSFSLRLSVAVTDALETLTILTARKTVCILPLFASYLRMIPEKDIDPIASSPLSAQMFSVVYFIGYWCVVSCISARYGFGS